MQLTATWHHVAFGCFLLTISARLDSSDGIVASNDDIKEAQRAHATDRSPDSGFLLNDSALTARFDGTDSYHRRNDTNHSRATRHLAELDWRERKRLRLEREAQEARAASRNKGSDSSGSFGTRGGGKHASEQRLHQEGSGSSFLSRARCGNSPLGRSGCTSDSAAAATAAAAYEQSHTGRVVNVIPGGPPVLLVPAPQDGPKDSSNGHDRSIKGMDSRGSHQGELCARSYPVSGEALAARLDRIRPWGALPPPVQSHQPQQQQQQQPRHQLAQRHQLQHEMSQRQDEVLASQAAATRTDSLQSTVRSPSLAHPSLLSANYEEVRSSSDGGYSDHSSSGSSGSSGRSSSDRSTANTSRRSRRDNQRKWRVAIAYHGHYDRGRSRLSEGASCSDFFLNAQNHRTALFVPMKQHLNATVDVFFHTYRDSNHCKAKDDALLQALQPKAYLFSPPNAANAARVIDSYVYALNLVLSASSSSESTASGSASSHGTGSSSSSHSLYYDAMLLARFDVRYAKPITSWGIQWGSNSGSGSGSGSSSSSSSSGGSRSSGRDSDISSGGNAFLANEVPTFSSQSHHRHYHHHHYHEEGEEPSPLLDSTYLAWRDERAWWESHRKVSDLVFTLPGAHVAVLRDALLRAPGGKTSAHFFYPKFVEGLANDTTATPAAAASTRRSKNADGITANKVPSPSPLTHRVKFIEPKRFGTSNVEVRVSDDTEDSGHIRGGHEKEGGDQLGEGQEGKTRRSGHDETLMALPNNLFVAINRSCKGRHADAQRVSEGSSSSSSDACWRGFRGSPLH